MEKRRVVITGLGTVNPLGTSVSASWDAAKAGKCGIGPITQFDTTDFKCKLAGEVKDFDPEKNLKGSNWYAYPSVRTYTAGVNVTF